MKKFALLLLVGILLIGVMPLAAQDDAIPLPKAPESCPDGEAAITMLNVSVGIEFTLAQNAVAAYMAACPNITVNLSEVPDSATDRLTQYLQFLNAKSSDVDIYQIDGVWPAILAENMIDLSPYIDTTQSFDFVVQNNTVDGKLVAAPWYIDAPVLYYRSDLLEQYGVDVPTTWDELTTAAQTVEDGVRADTGNTDFWGFVWQGGAYEGLTCDAHEWLVADTGDTFIKDDGSINVTDPAFIDALERAKGWVGTISPEGVTTYDEETSRAVWQAGNAAFMRNWPYAYSLTKADTDLQFDIAPLPTGASERAGACLGGGHLTVSAYSEHPEIAAAFVAYLTSYDLQKYRAIYASLNPTIPAVYEDAELQAANELFGKLGPMLEAAYPRPSTITGSHYAEASQLFFSAVHSVITGENDATTAMDDLHDDLQDLMTEISGS